MSEERGSGVVKGCSIGCAVVAIIIGIIAIALVYFLKLGVQKTAEAYTAESSLPMPEPDTDYLNIESLIIRFDDFREKLAKGEETPEPLELTSTEINALILHHPDFTAIADRVRFYVEGSILKGTVSFPFDELNIDVPLLSNALRGRFINGTGTFDLGL
ncbi:MAG: hypothetical protein AAF226_05565, partial [Verrucomicrobiota bacterium]